MSCPLCSQIQDFYVSSNGHLSHLDDPLQHGGVYHLEPRLCGGKGGEFQEVVPLWVGGRNSEELTVVCFRVRVDAASTGRSDREDDQSGGLQRSERPTASRREPRERVSSAPLCS